MRPGKIISGGQTGVDRAALAFAASAGIPFGGWAPKGWKAEDGTIPEEYRERMREHSSADYIERTHANIDGSDATLIVYRRDLLDKNCKFTGGTLRTARWASMRTIPLGWVFLDDGPKAIRDARAFVDNLTDEFLCCLNIAGPRESKAPGIYAATLALLREVWP